MNDAFYAWALFDIATGRLVLSGGFPHGMDVPREGARWLNGMKLSPGHRLKAIMLTATMQDPETVYMRDAVQQ